MKKLIALLLLLTVLFSYTACGSKDKVNDNSGGNNLDVSDNEQNEEQSTPSITIVVPEYKDYGRGTQSFDKLVYSRPNMQGVIDSFESVTAAILVESGTPEEHIAAIRTLEAPLSAVKSMYALAQIYNNKDSSIEYWQNEYEYISTNYPRLSKVVEDLLVACARSEHREAFETEYFGYSLEEYADGGIYTDEVVALMKEEARLESEYNSLSTATVEIEYKGVASDMHWQGTVDEVIANAQEYFKYDTEDVKYKTCLQAIDNLYKIARSNTENTLLVELIKIRRLIADELGYVSYSTLAYENMGYDYTPAEMLTLLGSIGQYAAPVASDLECSVFQVYFATNSEPRLSSTSMINTLYEVYSKLGGDYKDAYSYMLQHGLYDVSTSKSNRYGGAFTAYIDDNASPYLFMTTSGFISDYTTLSHEFGHFLDGYVNYGKDASLAISEISSQGLELLTLTKLRNNIPAYNYSYLEYYTMFIFLNSVLLTQSFYSAFEHIAYSLDYDAITKERLERAVEEAFLLAFGGEMTINGDLSYVTIPHTFLYPFYVESYVTSGMVSLDIFFKESIRTGNAGDGFALYEALIYRSSSDLGFIEQLEAANIDSPFSSDKVKEIADNIYYQIAGKHYYKTSDTLVDAA